MQITVSNYLSSLLLCHWLLVEKGARRLLVGSSNSWRQLGASGLRWFPLSTPSRGALPPVACTSPYLLLIPASPCCLYLCPNCCSNGKILGFNPPLLLLFSPSWNFLAPAHPVNKVTTRWEGPQSLSYHRCSMSKEGTAKNYIRSRVQHQVILEVGCSTRLY